jgi:hypothetical protein
MIFRDQMVWGDRCWGCWDEEVVRSRDGCKTGRRTRGLMSVGIVTILYHEATVKETFVLNSLVILWGLWMVVKERERKLEMHSLLLAFDRICF